MTGVEHPVTKNVDVCAQLGVTRIFRGHQLAILS
jgi:hypothetical protein